ncbi:MAG: sensor histidine kinase [Anaerolineae bacterium]|nr:sensor histidine kinase [Anaerolineae bacterium]
MEQESDLASRRLLAVTEEELSRIVLDIHDGPVQYLFASLSLLTQLQHQVSVKEPECTDLLPTINRAAELVEQSLHEIKSFLGTFRPPEFHRRSLSSIIQGLIIQHEEWTGHTVELQMNIAEDHIALPVKIALYRILQEALSNAYRHAGVNKQWVKLWNEKSYICLQIVDNGRGFQPPPLDGPKATEREEHIGLRGMRDRVKLLGGVFQLTSQPGKGTSITVKVPAYEVKETELWSQFE